MSKVKFEVMVDEIKRLSGDMDRYHNHSCLSDEGYVIWNKIKEDISGIITGVNESIESKENVKIETLLNWKRAVDDTRHYLVENLPKNVGAGNMGAEMTCCKMNALLNLMSGKMQGYINSVKKVDGVDCCKIATVERKIPEGMELPINASYPDVTKLRKGIDPEAEKQVVEDTMSESTLDLAKEELKVLEESLSVTNESFFTKQSKQFKEFRKSVNALNKVLANCKDDNVDLHADQIAEALAEVKFAKLSYDAHCRRHPQSDVTRGQRTMLVKEVMSWVRKLENDGDIKPSMDEATNKVSKKYAGLANAKKSKESVKKSVKNLHLTGISKKQYLADLKKAEEEMAEKVAKATEATKAKAREKLAKPENKVVEQPAGPSMSC